MIKLKKIRPKDLKEIHKIAYTKTSPRWAQMNAPYFNEYEAQDYDSFLANHEKFFMREHGILGIYDKRKIIGVVSSYWESVVTRWLEIGIVIYDETQCNKGLGKQALSQWIDLCFELHPEIERVGFTTWSGNLAMIALGERLSMTQEACIRKVRYYNGVYYDSIKYGVLRDEWRAYREEH